MKQKTNGFRMMLNSLISISSLNQGKAAKIIEQLKDEEVKIVVKNNEPIAAILSLKRFNELLEMEAKLMEIE